LIRTHINIYFAITKTFTLHVKYVRRIVQNMFVLLTMFKRSVLRDFVKSNTITSVEL